MGSLFIEQASTQLPRVQEKIHDMIGSWQKNMDIWGWKYGVIFEKKFFETAVRFFFPILLLAKFTKKKNFHMD